MTVSPGYMTPRRISVLISSATPEQLREVLDASIDLKKTKTKQD